MVGTVRTKTTGESYVEKKRLNQLLGSNTALVGAATAVLVANVPYATGVIVALGTYVKNKRRRGLSKC